MPGKPLSTQQIAALWRAYKIRQTADYVAKHCGVSWHTATKYIRNHNFAERYAKLQAKADELVDEDQAKSLARDLENITNIKSFIADALLDALKNKTFKPGTADYDRILRLERYLRGEPDSHIEQDFSFEWLDDDDDGNGNGNGEGDGNGNGNVDGNGDGNGDGGGGGDGNGNVDGNGNREGADKSA